MNRIINSSIDPKRIVAGPKASNKDGMVFQPELGVYEKVHQIDLLPLSFDHSEVQPLVRDKEHSWGIGFLASVISSLLNL